MNLKEFSKYINNLAKYPNAKKYKVGFCLTFEDGHHEFFEIEKSDIELGTFENTDFNWLCLGDFKGNESVRTN